MIINDNSIIFHIDVNSAYLSWSALRELQNGSKLDLRTIPSIVGGDQETRHGIVVAKSIPAKAFGIQTAETVASAFQKCPTLVMVPPDHTYYREMSQKLMHHLSRSASMSVICLLNQFEVSFRLRRQQQLILKTAYMTPLDLQ